MKLQLLPDKQHKVKTRVMRRTLNPVYDEDFTFYGVNFDQLPVSKRYKYVDAEKVTFELLPFSAARWLLLIFQCRLLCFAHHFSSAWKNSFQRYGPPYS